MTGPARSIDGEPHLQRRLGLADAVTVGAGSMIGAGVFSAWGPAADAAGTGLLIGLVVAAVVAFCNATSSAQLAAVHPESGGTYVYARRQLGPFWGHLAGWGFVVGKTASCVALALTAGAYLWPEHARLVGVAAVAVVAIVNIGGLTRTVAVTKCLLAVALVALAAVVVAGWSSPTTSLARITPIDTSPAGVLRAAGFLFFAFAGYARIATLGEEVRDPATTIPKAIPRALAGVLVIYAAVGVTLLATVPVDAIAASDAPLGLVVERLAIRPARPDRAHRRRHRRPRRPPQPHPRRLPHRARDGPSPRTPASGSPRSTNAARCPCAPRSVVTAVVIVLTATLDLRGAIGFSGVTILTYYAITNAACLTLPRDQRRWPRSIGVVGLAGCVTLAVMLPLAAIITGAAVLVTGVLIRRLARAARHSRRDRRLTSLGAEDRIDPTAARRAQPPMPATLAATARRRPHLVREPQTALVGYRDCVDMTAGRRSTSRRRRAAPAPTRRPRRRGARWRRCPTSRRRRRARPGRCR